jgi:hypothetical protein
MSDTPVIQALLDQVAAGKFVTIPPGDYSIDSPLTLNYAANAIGGGCVAYGANLHSTITNGADLLTVNIEAGGKVVRGQRFRGLNLFGSKTDGHGLKIVCPAGSWFYNFVFADMMVENFGGDGVNALGTIFEGEFANISPRGNAGNGATIGSDTAGGVASSLSWTGGSCGQNGKVGMLLANYFYDLTCDGVYFLENGSYGLQTTNGIMRLSGKGFENNQQALPAGQVGSAIRLLNFGNIGPLTCGGNNGKQTTLLDGAYITQQTNLIGCRGQMGSIGGTGGVVNAVGCQTVPTAANANIHIVAS